MCKKIKRDAMYYCLGCFGLIIVALAVILPLVNIFYPIDCFYNTLDSEYLPIILNVLILIASICLYANSGPKEYGKKDVLLIASLVLLTLSTLSIIGDLTRILNNNGPDFMKQTYFAIILYLIIIVAYISLSIFFFKLRKKTNDKKKETAKQTENSK